MVMNNALGCIGSSHSMSTPKKVQPCAQTQQKIDTFLQTMSRSGSETVGSTKTLEQHDQRMLAPKLDSDAYKRRRRINDDDDDDDEVLMTTVNNGSSASHPIHVQDTAEESDANFGVYLHPRPQPSPHMPTTRTRTPRRYKRKRPERQHQESVRTDFNPKFLLYFSND